MRVLNKVLLVFWFLKHFQQSLIKRKVSFLLLYTICLLIYVSQFLGKENDNALWDENLHNISYHLSRSVVFLLLWYCLGFMIRSFFLKSRLCWFLCLLLIYHERVEFFGLKNVSYWPSSFPLCVVHLFFFKKSFCNSKKSYKKLPFQYFFWSKQN